MKRGCSLRFLDRRFGLCILGAVLFLAGRASAQETASGAQVIHPRAAESLPPSAAGRAEGGHSVTLLGFGLVAAGVGGWLLWRQRGGAFSQAKRAPRRLQVTETRGLGNRQYLVVADYRGQKFLLGVCPGRIEMLSPLAEADEDEAP